MQMAMKLMDIMTGKRRVVVMESRQQRDQSKDIGKQRMTKKEHPITTMSLLGFQHMTTPIRPWIQR